MSDASGFRVFARQELLASFWCVDCACGRCDCPLLACDASRKAIRSVGGEIAIGRGETAPKHGDGTGVSTRMSTTKKAEKKA